jgi:hypothetical protein
MNTYVVDSSTTNFVVGALLLKGHVVWPFYANISSVAFDEPQLSI